MIVALYILLALVVTGAVLYALHRRDLARNPHESESQPAAEPTAEDEECCGMHITCEKDSLLASVSAEIVYYDDEELDRFRGRRPDEYTDDEIEEFRNVLLTLLPDDIAGWGRSIQLRGIELPSAVRDELLMIVAEARLEANVATPAV
ncbi:MAG: phospholipase [Paramuribaculum sp.]|nr:phospholipase [Paramuribaculum sp.]